MNKKYFLHDDWKFTLHKKDEEGKIPGKKIKFGKWINSEIPGTVHTDLMKAELIPEPFYSDNETRLQWIGEIDWLYQTSFDFPKKISEDKKTYLVFESIDTAAEIFLNDKSLGCTNNMFIKYSFEVSKLLRKKNNKLEVVFTSAEKYAKAEEVKCGKLPVALRSERVYIRKAQYSFGWDWGPAFLTMGILRPVYLLQPNEIHIEDFTFETLSISDNNAAARIKFSVDEPFNSKMKIRIALKDSKQKMEFEELPPVGSKEFIKEFEIKNPNLWWPNGSGDQHLYDLEIKIEKEKIVLDELNKKIGIRTIKLQLNENNKPTFRFVINNVPIFLKGADWIPADSFLPRVSNEKYRSLLSMAAIANMNVIRVWGGGIYENDVFYDLCDELGILIWQDFMFACASYPEHEEFLENAAEEAAQNILRLQYHPSIAIWCGNNENEWIWYREHRGSIKELPGYRIYHDVIPEIVKRLDPLRPYWPSTPFGFDEDPNSELTGNRHQWEIWSLWMDYKKVRSDKSLFVTEFGFQSPANFETMKSILPEDQFNPQSKIFEFHNKQVEGPERLFKFLSSHLPVKTELKDFIYLTQLNHGLALKECLEHWQLRFPETNGAIIWQLNDCWPVSSWSLIDSDLIPKMPYFFVKSAFSKQIIGFFENKDEIRVTVQNNDLQKFTGSFEINFISLSSGETKSSESKSVKFEPQSQKIIYSYSELDKLKNGEEILVVTLRDKNKEIIHRNLFSGLEFKHLKIRKAVIKIREERNAVLISADRTALFVYLQSQGKIFEDNGFVILPKEKIKVKFSSSNKSKSKIEAICLNQYLE